MKSSRKTQLGSILRRDRQKIKIKRETKEITKSTGISFEECLHEWASRSLEGRSGTNTRTFVSAETLKRRQHDKIKIKSSAQMKKNLIEITKVIEKIQIINHKNTRIEFNF